MNGKEIDHKDFFGFMGKILDGNRRYISSENR